MELLALSEVAARCGDNVTLTCDATLPDKSVIKHFAWEAGNKTCQIDNDIHDSKFLCESRVNTHTHQLTLTLLNVMPVDERRYLCKLRTVQGTKSATTFVKVHGELNLFYFFHHCLLFSSFGFLKVLDLYRMLWKCDHLHQLDSCWEPVQRSLPQWHHSLVPGRCEPNGLYQHRWSQRSWWTVWCLEHTRRTERRPEPALYMQTVDTFWGEVFPKSRFI